MVFKAKNILNLSRNKRNLAVNIPKIAPKTHFPTPKNSEGQVGQGRAAHPGGGGRQRGRRPRPDQRQGHHEGAKGVYMQWSPVVTEILCTHSMVYKGQPIRDTFRL